MHMKLSTDKPKSYEVDHLNLFACPATWAWHFDELIEALHMNKHSWYRHTGSQMVDCASQDLLIAYQSISGDGFTRYLNLGRMQSMTV